MTEAKNTCTNSGCEESCCEGCESKPQSFIEAPGEFTNVKKVIAVVSGKGGVGKSLVTGMLAVTMNRLGYKTAILDADITGPSIPRMFGLKQKAQASELGLHAVKTKTGIGVMSINLLLENDTDPVVWRGPIISNTVKQFWTDVVWDDVDFMFIDMPPGTGDVALTVFQSVPVDGIIVVTSPQELVSMIVAKAVNMAKKMDVPILGIVENMSYIECPECGKKITVFGESHIEKVGLEHGILHQEKVPIDSKLAAACDRGMIELFDADWLNMTAVMLESKL